MIDVDEARARLFAAAPRLGTETAPLAEAVGRVLAEPVVALRDQPPFPASAMDGYALRAIDTQPAGGQAPDGTAGSMAADAGDGDGDGDSDGEATDGSRIAAASASGSRIARGAAAGGAPTDGRAPAAGAGAAGAAAGGGLHIVGEAAAGRRFAGTVGPLEAVRIFTGAPVPPGADAILIQEDAEIRDGRLYPKEAVAPGTYLRPAALDFSRGDTLLRAGTRLEPRHVALAGAAGTAHLTVARRPRVAFLATGDELVPPGAPTGPDSIVASTTPALAAMVRRAGGEPIDLGIAPDDRAAIAARAKEGLIRADILVTLGGASVGDHDLVQPALGDLGVELDFWKVAVRPGKPLMFASRPLVLGLPGNPVSGLVCSILFLVPLVEALQGVASPGPTVRNATLGAPLEKNGPRRDHLRARWQDGRLVPFDRQDSSMLGVLARADALIVRMPFAPAAQAGEACAYLAL